MTHIEGVRILQGIAAFWPLVVRVRIGGPFPGAHPNVTLVDAPGVQDANSARGEVVKRLLKDVHFRNPYFRCNSHRFHILLRVVATETVCSNPQTGHSIRFRSSPQ